jgi:hypothetical protein
VHKNTKKTQKMQKNEFCVLTGRGVVTIFHIADGANAKQAKPSQQTLLEN